MNKVTLLGNLTRDPEIRYINTVGGQVAVTKFTLAVSRQFKKSNGESKKETLFMPCIAWSSGAEAIDKYFSKGSKILIEGSLVNESWEKDGENHTRTVVRVDEFYFPGDKKSSDTQKVSQTEMAEATLNDDNIPF